MEIIYFTAAGILLYLGSDWILNKIEQARGELLPQRSVIFFLIILTLSVGLFQGIQHFITPPIDTNSVNGGDTNLIQKDAQ